MQLTRWFGRRGRRSELLPRKTPISDGVLVEASVGVSAPSERDRISAAKTEVAGHQRLGETDRMEGATPAEQALQVDVGTRQEQESDCHRARSRVARFRLGHCDQRGKTAA